MRKTIFTLGLMLAAALSLTSCSKNEEVNFTPELKPSFELFANLDSRTVNVVDDDRIGTDWAAGDAINVFHAVATSDDYKSDGSFSTEDASGLFKGNLSEELTAEAYDWYALYPYKSYITTPAEQTEGYVYIGSKSNEVQTQNGNNSMAHIAGKNYPLVGVVKNVPASVKPEITMSHISSLVEFNVTNTLDEDITVTAIRLTSVEDIIGSYYINFAGDDVVYKNHTEYWSATATLEVKNGTPIKKGESAKFYMAIKPHSVDDDFLKVEVDATAATGNGTFSKSYSNVTTSFVAGKIKTIKVNFNAEIETPSELTATIDFANKNLRTEFNSSKQVWSNAGITLTNTKDASTSNIGDYANPARFYKSSKIEVVSAVGNMTKIQFVCNNSEYATALKSVISGSTVSGNTITVVFNEPTTTFTASLTAGQVRMNSLTVTYTPTDDEPFISLANSSIEVEAAATTKEVGVTLINITEQVTITKDAAWVEATLENNTIKLAIAENTTTDARKANVTLSANGVDATLTINQKAPTTLETVTIAEFLSKPVNTTAFYQLTGTIINIEETTFGNLTIKDETGEVYVYGLKQSATASNQSFSQIGVKAGDIVTLIGNRGVYNNNPQVTNAYYVKHEVGEEIEVVITPLTIAEFLAKPVSTSALYQLTGEITDIANTTYGNLTIKDETGEVYVYGLKKNATAGKQTFSELGLKVGDVVTLVGNRAAYNDSPQVGNAYYVSHTTPTTPEPDPEPEPEDPTPGTGGGTDDFATINVSNSYGTYKTTAGWNCVNCCVLRGGNSNSNPNFIMFGEPTTHAICMNGKTSTVGTITSPILTAGCGTLEFNYGIPYGDSKIKFKVEIMQNGAVVKTFTVDKTSATKFAVYSHEETVNVAGDFQIVFTNLCPSNNSSSNKDRTAIWNVEWTGYNN